MKKQILSTTGLVLAIGLVASPVFAAQAPKAKPQLHAVKAVPTVEHAFPVTNNVAPKTTPLAHVTKTVPTATPVSQHVTKAVPNTTLVSHDTKKAQKGKGPQKAKLITTPNSHVKDAQKFLEPVTKNIAKVTNAVQSLTKSVSAFKSSDIPTELAFYKGTLGKLTGESNQINALTKQVDQIAKKYGKTTDVSNAYALIAVAKTSITSEVTAVQASIKNLTTVVPTTTTTTTGTTDGSSTTGTTTGTTTGSTTGSTTGTTTGSTDGSTSVTQ